MRGRHVELTELTDDAFPQLLEWQNDPEIAKWMDYRTPFTMEDIRHDINRARSEGQPYLIVYQGRAIGKCGLNQYQPRTRSRSMYIYVGEKGLHGHGLGFDALMALLRCAFAEECVDVVELTVISDNDRARRTYLRAGFQVDRNQRDRSYRDGAWQRTVAMSVTRERFERSCIAYGLER